jgi:hypothetical protein
MQTRLGILFGLFIGLSSLAAVPSRALGQGEVESVQTPVDTVTETAAEDTVGHDSVSTATRVDPAYIWRTWKDLSRAIQLRDLDGPEDIMGKADIIKDRIDDLSEERKKLATARQEWSDRNDALEIQLEVLEDLAKVQLGGDLQLQQRMHRMREGRSVAGNRLEVMTRSISDLDIEVGGLTEMVTQYKKQAVELRRREAQPR